MNPQRWRSNPNIHLSITVSHRAAVTNPGTGRGPVVPQRIVLCYSGGSRVVGDVSVCSTHRSVTLWGFDVRSDLYGNLPSTSKNNRCDARNSPSLCNIIGGTIMNWTEFDTLIFGWIRKHPPHRPYHAHRVTWWNWAALHTMLLQNWAFSPSVWLDSLRLQTQVGLVRLGPRRRVEAHIFIHTVKYV